MEAQKKLCLMRKRKAADTSGFVTSACEFAGFLIAIKHAAIVTDIHLYKW